VWTDGHDKDTLTESIEESSPQMTIRRLFAEESRQFLQSHVRVIAKMLLDITNATARLLVAGLLLTAVPRDGAATRSQPIQQQADGYSGRESGSHRSPSNSLPGSLPSPDRPSRNWFAVQPMLQIGAERIRRLA